MPKVTFVEFDGSTHSVDAEAGSTLMSTALDHGVPGILADCGGDCSCATCHVFIPEQWSTVVGLPNPTEDELLEAREDRQPNSRLSCQITLGDQHDGLRVDLPEDQF